MTNPIGVKLESRAFNSNDEDVVNNATSYLMERVAPNMADLKDDQQLDLNDSHFVDSTPGLEEYVKAFSPFFPQVFALRNYRDLGFNDHVNWGHLETLTQLLPAIAVGIKRDRVNLTDMAMVQFAEMVFRKGKQVATGTLDIRDEKDEKGQA